MEEVPGIELEQVWPKMSIEDRLAVVKSIVGFQKAWTSVSFTNYGSLYFSRDLEGALAVSHSTSTKTAITSQLKNSMLGLRQHARPSVAEEESLTLTEDLVSRPLTKIIF
jgi:hypothetical protein